MRVSGMLRIAVTLGLAAAVVSPGILAQEAKSSKTAPAKKPSQEVVAKAKFIKSNWGEKKTVLMKGNVVFTHDDTVITSDEVNYDDALKSAISPGPIKIVNPDCDITGDKGSAYFRKKVGVVEGNVVMLLRPTPDDSAAPSKDSIDKFKQPTTVTCNHMEYFYAKKLASAEGKVVFKQPKRTAYADKAIYDQKKELLTLTGNVRATDEEGQTFSAPGTVEISLKKGDEWMQAPDANASFKIDLGDEEQPKE